MTVGVWFDFGHTKCQWEVDGTTRKKGPDGHGRDKKPESWMAVLDFVEPCCLCLLSFWSVFFSLASNHCPFPFPQPTWCFQRPLGQSRFFSIFEIINELITVSIMDPLSIFLLIEIAHDQVNPLKIFVWIKISDYFKLFIQVWLTYK